MELHYVRPVEDLTLCNRSWMKSLHVSGSVKHQHHNQSCLSPRSSLKPVACYALSHPFTVQTPPSPTLYKKKLVFSEQKLLLLLGWDFPDFWVILVKPRNFLKAVALETTNHFIVEA